MAAALLAGCVAGNSPIGPVEWDDKLDLGVPGEVIGTEQNVRFYPACGNEVLNWEGSTWYQFTPANEDEFPVPALAAAGPLFEVETVVLSTAGEPTSGLAAVAAPEPGDDVGTLVSYEGGFAFWVSANGRLSTWLTDDEIEYPWVC